MKIITTNFHFSALFLVLLLPTIVVSTDTLTGAQNLSNDRTLVSSGNVFELGFFTPPANSGKWYVGIWYKNISEKTFVWVANRDNPLTNSTGILTIRNNTIVLLDESENTVWSSNQTVAVNPVAQLLDNGNFVLRESAGGEVLWQSFDYPTDTLLPEMKLGWDLKNGVNRFLNSWQATNDPSAGNYSFKLEYRGYPEFLLYRNNRKRYRSGPWNGIRFSGVPEMNPTEDIGFNFTTEPNDVYYSFKIHNNDIISRLFVDPGGALRRMTWIPSNQVWNNFWFAPKDQCDYYRECGPYGICDTNTSPVCNCMRGFQPSNPRAWGLRDGSGGCVRKTDLECPKDKFLHLKNMKLPESTTSFVDRNMGFRECEDLCLRNCSCKAYAVADIRYGGTGCVFWFDDLIDMRRYAEGGQDLYVRLAASDIGDGRRAKSLIIGLSVGGGVLVLAIIYSYLWTRKACFRRRKADLEKTGNKPVLPERSQDFLLNEVVHSSKRDYSGKTTEELELPLFDFDTVVMATRNFDNNNKLGQGGFGSVYKGRLGEGEVAVKRLSKNSGQGVEEFKNEVRLISKLQHRNLVRLLGCCIETNEKMLIYEYMENRSLDSVLFNKAKSALLNWQRRFNIICGIARGLLYLHQDSRFRIIHRDLKASNILLDKNMNPKISDFGMARIFGGDQIEANTKRVVGTYGYMSPEYAMDGLFSVKSDVFSFGVLVLEIISGKKNRGFYQLNSDLNLLGYVWRLWKEEKGLEIIDSFVGDDYPPNEVLRCIEVGLLCVQERAEDRPKMSSVVLMLSSETAKIPQPKTPGFCLGRSPLETDSSSCKQDESFTVNQVTVTAIDGR